MAKATMKIGKATLSINGYTVLETKPVEIDLLKKSRRKYINIKVSNHVNVSSSGHYHFKVWWKGGQRDYSLGVGFLTNGGNFHNWQGAPKYLTAEVERQIAEMFANGIAKFYEYDRDGNTRYENLRYYDADEVASWVKYLTDVGRESAGGDDAKTN